MNVQTPLPLILVTILVSLLQAQGVSAGSATWKLNPTSDDWNTAANWTPTTVPNGATDTATFALSNITGVSLSAITTVNGIAFSAGASAFTIRPQTLEISGTGLTNNSGITQTFVNDVRSQNGFLVGGRITFLNGATAGSATNFVNNAGAIPNTAPSAVLFEDTSTAGSAILTNNGSSVSDGSGAGIVLFSGSSTASNATIINNGGTGSALGGFTQFLDSSTAAAAILIANTAPSGGNGGSIQFGNDAAGGTARIEVFGNGILDLGNRNPPGVTIGSLEGDGSVLLGANSLTIGTNNLRTTFAGVIEGSGSLIMGGSTRLTLLGANTYLGGTIMNLGGLVANNARGSATGPGPVQVNRDTLGGRGTIAGAVTIGDGGGPKAYLETSVDSSHATLTIQSTLTFKRDGSYNYKLNTNSMVADQVVANGVTIGRGATFNFNTVGNKALPIGMVFTVINNTSALSISGAFTNLLDGTILTAGRNNYQASYSGGDGNDLTLTVVP